MPTNPKNDAQRKPITHLSDLPWIAPVPWEKMSPKEQAAAGRIIDRRLPGLSPEKRQEACERILTLTKILITGAMREVKFDQRLLKEPDGFDPGLGYTCCYCSAPATWHSKWKRTCDRCYAAFWIGRYPFFVATHPESFFRRRDIERDLGLTSKQLDKLVKEGRLIARGD